MAELIDRYTRTRILFGNAFEHIQNKKVIVFGVGGVGGFVVDCLYRSGLKNITIVDKDCFDVTTQFDIMKFDYIIDAIDDIYAKVEIAKIASNKPFGKYIVSTGSAKKLNPLQIQVSSIWKTYGDKFARKFRDHLKKADIKKPFKAVFSPEVPKCKNLGSFSAVTASFGLTIASEIIQHIIKEEHYA